jgi:4-hydroxy-tetrahydrodipicolinate synthase
MAYSKLIEQLKTINAINITAFDAQTKEIDWQGTEANIEFLIAHGLKVIVPCGNTGEFYALTIEEAKAVTKRVTEIVAGRAVVVAGVGYSVKTAIELGQAAAEAGADAVMIHNPIHPYITNSGAVSYFESIINALDIPSLVYFKDANLSDNVLKQLAPNPKLVGVKYAINDLPRFTSLIREVPAEHNVAWICGTAEKWAPYFYYAGAEGFTSGLVNLLPETSFELLHALKSGDQETVWRIWRQILPFENLRAKYNAGNNVVVVKEAMNLLGFNAGVTREPVNPLEEQDRQELKLWLQANQLL